MLYLGADHAGFLLKEKLKKVLVKKKIKFVDLGAQQLKPKDDYFVYAVKVAKAVVKKGHHRGILICGSGEGMSIAANKVKGARATPIYDVYTAKMSRLHNDANIATLRSRNFANATAIKLVLLWLKTPFAGGRHQARVKKLK